MDTNPPVTNTEVTQNTRETGGSGRAKLPIRITKHSLVWGVVVLALIVGLVIGWHFYDAHHNQQQNLHQARQESQAHLQRLVNETDQEIKQASNPTQQAALYEAKAAYLTDEGKQDEALQAYKQAYKLNPSIEVMTTLAAAYTKMKDKADSLELYEKAIAAIQADPNSPYKSNLKYYQDVVSNLKQNDFSLPKEKGSWLGA